MPARRLSAFRASTSRSGLLPVAGLLMLLAVATAGFYTSQAQRASNIVTLPILVYPPDGVSEHVETVTLTVDNPSGVDRLYVQAHQPFYHRGGTMLHHGPDFDPETAAAIRVNGGAWIPVDDEHVTCAHGAALRGCVAGAFSTIRFSIPVENVQAGANVVAFKFNESKGARSGYRVLAVGFMRPGDELASFNPFEEGAHDESLLTRENPSTWTAPPGGNPARGEQLWHEAQLLESVLSGETMQATCAMCHAEDGSDLKYFNYSNRVIEARARFHGLTQGQAEDIAAYIRSIELRTEEGQTYEAPGRPWQPPYQPGPTALATRAPTEERTAGQAFSEAGAHTWAAGAGLAWVLSSGDEMLPYLFAEQPLSEDPSPTVDRLPAGHPAAGALNWHQISMDSVLNVRAIPVSIQFPDWNNWLPDVHPIDYAPAAYAGLTDELAEARAEADKEPYPHKYRHFADAIQQLMLAYRAEGFQWGGVTRGRPQWEREHLAMAGYQWMLTKVWAITTEHHLQNKADDAYCDFAMDPYCEPLAWLGRQRWAFNVAPHMNIRFIGDVGDYHQAPHIYGSWPLETFMSHAWYQLQMTLNSGSAPGSSPQVPLTWQYHVRILKDTAVEYDLGVGYRMVEQAIKSWQLASTPRGVDGTGGEGLHRAKLKRAWSPSISTLWTMLSMRANSGAYGTVFQNLSHAERNDLLNALLRAWQDYNGRFPVSAFPRTEEGEGAEMGNHLYGAEDVKPILGTQTFKGEWAEIFYKGLYGVTRDSLASPRAVAPIAQWGEAMWPLGDWEQLMQGASPATVRITNLINGNTFTAPIDLVVEVDAYIADGSITKVELLVDGNLIEEKADKPYRFTWEDVPVGQHTITARATDDSGNQAVTSVMITVTEPTSSATHSIALDKGWNLISSRVAPANPGVEFVSADLLDRLVLIKDENGGTYVPRYQINTIDLWESDEAYMVYLSDAATLEMRGAAVASATPISLTTGWNLVPYWPEAPLHPREAFVSIAPALVKVKDAAGRAYVPGEKNEIGQLQPGQGYKVYVSEPVELTYPQGARAAHR